MVVLLGAAMLSNVQEIQNIVSNTHNGEILYYSQTGVKVTNTKKTTTVKEVEEFLQIHGESVTSWTSICYHKKTKSFYCAMCIFENGQKRRKAVYIGAYKNIKNLGSKLEEIKNKYIDQIVDRVKTTAEKKRRFSIKINASQQRSCFVVVDLLMKKDVVAFHFHHHGQKLAYALAKKHMDDLNMVQDHIPAETRVTCFTLGSLKSSRPELFA